MARTRALDYADKEGTILRTAARLFSSEGVERTSMAMIAADSGYSKAALYHYYTSKEALLFDIVYQHVELLITDVGDALSKIDETGGSSEERLRAMVSALLTAYGRNEDQHRIQLAGLDSLSRENREEISVLERELVSEFATVIETLMPKGKCTADFVKPVTMSLFGMLNWHYMWFREKGPMSRDDYATLATSLITDGLGNLGK